MTVEVLYLADCPQYRRLLPRLRLLMQELAPDAELVLHRIDSFEDAERERFLGSPTVRIDGEDLEPGAGSRSEFGLECRLYRDRGTASPLPPESWIRDALERR